MRTYDYLAQSDDEIDVFGYDTIEDDDAEQALDDVASVLRGREGNNQGALTRTVVEISALVQATGRKVVG